MRIAFAGDWHASPEAAWAALEACAERGVERIVHVGDFMYTGTDKHRFLRSLDKGTRRFGIPLSFIRGNHDDTNALRRIVAATDKPTPEGFFPVTDAIHYIQDGTQWEWEGVRLAGLGGAFSVDHRARREGVSWWPDEVTDREAAARLMREGQGTDILVTHDFPEGLPIRSLEVPQGWLDIAGNEPNQRLIREVVEAVEPQYLISGHMHLRQTERFQTRNGVTTSIILDRGDYVGRERNPQVVAAALLIMDLDNGSIRR